MAEFADGVKEYEDLSIALRGQGKQGQRTDLTSSNLDEVGWTHQDTADSLGLSRPSIIRAIKIATATEEHPELAGLNSGITPFVLNLPHP